MDRRRYVPSSEGLEARAVLSNIFTGTNALTNLNPVVDLPNTAELKAVRIQRLPFFLENFEPNRFLPKSATAPIQADLNQIKGELHSPPSATLDNFNVTVRDIIPHQTLSTDDARRLSQAFGIVLHNAGTTPQQEASFKADMNNLARIDSQDINPVILATNDYSIVLQAALGVGRPIHTPTAPTLAAVDHVGPKGSQITRNPTPHLVGTYDAGTTIHVLDANFNVIGSTVVDKNGKYLVEITTPLAPGVHSVRVQAIDQGLISPPSPVFKFKVLSPPVKLQSPSAHPQGPLGSTK